MPKEAEASEVQESETAEQPLEAVLKEVVIAYLLLKAFGVKKIEDVKNEADLNYIKYEFDNLKSSAYFGAKKYRKDDFNIIHEPSGLGVEKEDGEPSCVIRKVRHCTYLNKAELFARDARKEVGE